MLRVQMPLTKFRENEERESDMFSAPFGMQGTGLSGFNAIYGHGSGRGPSPGSGGGVPLGGVSPADNPYIVDTVPLGAASAGGGAAAGGIGSLLSSFLSPQGIASLASLIPALLSGGGGGGVPQQSMRGMEDAIAMTNARTRRADPLHEAITQLAFQRLPISAREGITLPRVPLPPQRT